MGLFCEVAFKKSFEHSVSKQAYLNACKWLAVNIYNNAEFAKNVVVEIKKESESELPTFVVTIYAKIDESEQRASYCKRCKMLHTIFYSIDGMKCTECKCKGYQKTLDEDINGIRQFVSESLIRREEQ